MTVKGEAGDRIHLDMFVRSRKSPHKFGVCLSVLFSRIK
jgi:hypothetical protein